MSDYEARKLAERREEYTYAKVHIARELRGAVAEKPDGTCFNCFAVPGEPCEEWCR